MSERADHLDRIAELEALTQPFTQSELARAEGVLNIAIGDLDAKQQIGLRYTFWLRSTVQAVAEALVANSREQGAVDG